MLIIISMDLALLIILLGSSCLGIGRVLLVYWYMLPYPLLIVGI